MNRDMLPSANYRALVQQPGFVDDPAQRRAIGSLDDLFARIEQARPPSGWRGWFGQRQRWPSVRGVYFWGGVGRGKTLLMDLFYQDLPDSIPARRTHFHSFMNEVHHALKSYRNTAAPLARVAQDIASRTRVLCLDEFVIIDIGDAMIMAGLLEALLADGVVLVTTSNAAPQDLYRDGLQRARFLPAIDLIARNCEVINLDGEQDYRLRFLQQTELYSAPHSQAREDAIRSYLDQHVVPVQTEQHELVINGRRLEHRYCAEDTVWFSFAELCESTRSQSDYLELARFFNTLILTEIRQMQAADDDVARRFVLLIDVIYDHRVKLMCTAEVLPGELYQGNRLAFEFERTVSRLIEMQSSDYLAQAHTLQ